jgi:hypothetical protein
MSYPLSLFEHEFTDGINWTNDDAIKISQLNNKLSDTILGPRVNYGEFAIIKNFRPLEFSNV